MISTKKSIFVALTLIFGALMIFPAPASASSADTIDWQVHNGLRRLYANNPEARALGRQAKAVLVFPKIVKGGFLFAGAYGEGALVSNGSVVGYYCTSAGSYGFQAGIEQYGYAMFFMTDSSLRYLNKSHGWAVGTGPTVVIGDNSFAKSITTNSLGGDVYAFFFSQRGLMAGMGLQGTKISRIYPD
ncbi:MAG: lipid-binding SYLF domain-containing protein [Verrucomicrobiota bacterium]